MVPLVAWTWKGETPLPENDKQADGEVAEVHAAVWEPQLETLEGVAGLLNFGYKLG